MSTATTHDTVGGTVPSLDRSASEPTVDEADDSSTIDDAIEAGRNADSVMDAATRGLELQGLPETTARNLAAGAMTLLITLMIVLLAALVDGKFAGAIPSGSPFSTAIQTTTDNAGTAFVIFGVSLLAIPTTAVLAYMITRLGGFIGFNAGAARGLRRR